MKTNQVNQEVGFKKLLESIPDGVVICDSEGIIIQANKNAEDLFGYPQEGLTGMQVEELIPFKYRTGHRKQRSTYITNPVPRYMKTDLGLTGLRKDGSEVPVGITLSPLEIASGTLVICAIRDITDQVKSLDEIHRLAEFPRKNPMPVVETNAEGQVVYINPAAEVYMKQIGTSEKDFAQLLSFDYKELAVQSITKGKKIPGQEVHLDGKTFLWTGHALPNLKLVHYYATDITELKNTERELIEAKERAEGSDRLKNAFLGSMSHEVRTPLNVILGYVDLLAGNLEKHLSDEEQEFVETINMAGNRLKHLMDDILDISLIEADRNVLNLENILPDEVVERALKEIRLSAGDKKLELIGNLEAQNIRIKVDNQRFHQVMGNILQNAVKFTKMGSIKVNSSVNDSEYWVTVADTGIGIHKKFLPYVFKQFRQAEEGYSRSYEGAGLGMAISYRLVTAMGGSIEVESEHGKGSRFTVRFPVSRILKTEPLEKVKSSDKPNKSYGVSVEVEQLQGKTLLVVEDNSANSRYAQFLLKKLGINSIAVSSGEKALETVKESFVDGMLVDISLVEGMSGLRFAEKIREDEKFKNTPLIAVTAHAMEGQKKEFLSAGFNDYLSKPYVLSDLQAILSRNLEK